jgi:hypothetical protein
MDTVTAFAKPVTEVGTSAAPATSQTAQTLTVTATYQLSEEGRKASLLAGGDGRAVQQIQLQVPTNRLHLVSVDPQGVARLKLRPQYRLEGERVVRVDATPTYDAPPDVESLFREAARNHQLERVYESERRSARSKRRDANRERRAHLAQAFLTNPDLRALVHPAPSPKRCFLATEHGRVMFDAVTDEPPARDVPLEAHRRFRADLRARRERNLQERSAQLELHEEKKRFIAEWIAVNGTAEQRDRQAAGMLPMEEAIEAITDHALSALADHRRYVRDGAERLQAHLRQLAEYAHVTVAANDVVVTGANAVKATAAQWAAAREIHTAAPDATVTLRFHKVALRRDPKAPTITIPGILVTRRVGPFTLRREYAVLD